MKPVPAAVALLALVGAFLVASALTVEQLESRRSGVVDFAAAVVGGRVDQHPAAVQLREHVATDADQLRRARGDGFLHGEDPFDRVERCGTGSHNEANITTDAGAGAAKYQVEALR